MDNTTHVLKLALEALQFAYNHCDSDWVQDEKINPAITAIKEALAQPEQEPVAWYRDEDGIRIYYESKVWDDATPLYTTPPQRKEPEQEPVAWLTEERYAEMHTSKWTPKIQQVFSKDGILESQTIQYAPQSKTVPYPLAQRTWLGLTDEEAVQTWEGVIKYAPGDVRIKDFARAIETKLKEKNT